MSESASDRILSQVLSTTAEMNKDIGRAQAALKAHEDRMDRTDAAIQLHRVESAARFDRMDIRFDKQDESLALLIRQTDRSWGRASVWTKIGAGALALLGAVISGHWILFGH